eukprot:scaffold896_cov172-Amphora_coffeaeformis.AAC.13
MRTRPEISDQLCRTAEITIHGAILDVPGPIEYNIDDSFIVELGCDQRLSTAPRIRVVLRITSKRKATAVESIDEKYSISLLLD